MDETPDMTGDERAELERLRAEVATLRAQVQRGDTAPVGPVAAGRRAARQRWRTIVAVVLITIACVLAPLSVVAVWTKNQVTNTDRYVATVTPLASNPDIQNAIADQITNQVFTYIDVKGLTTQAVDALAGRGLPPRIADQLQALEGPIAGGIQSFTRTQVGKIVQSQAFADAWTQANRVAHQALVKTLTGQGDGAVTVQGDTVSLNLAPFIARQFAIAAHPWRIRTIGAMQGAAISQLRQQGVRTGRNHASSTSLRFCRSASVSRTSLASARGSTS